MAILEVGLGDTLAQVSDWLQEVAGLRAARHQVEQRLVRRGHLDHQTATWQLMHFTRRGGVDGLEGHILQGGHVEHRFGGHARTLHRSARLQEDAGLPTVRHHAEQTGEGIWITTRFGGHTRTLHHGGVCGGFQKDVGSPAARHQAEQRLDR